MEELIDFTNLLPPLDLPRAGAEVFFSEFFWDGNREGASGELIWGENSGAGEVDLDELERERQHMLREGGGHGEVGSEGREEELSRDMGEGEGEDIDYGMPIS